MSFASRLNISCILFARPVYSCSRYWDARISGNVQNFSCRAVLFTPPKVLSHPRQPRLSPTKCMVVVRALSLVKNSAALRCNTRHLVTKTRTAQSGESVSSFQPLRFGDQTAERSTISKSLAMRRYLLNEETLSRIKPFRPAWRTADGEAQYLLQVAVTSPPERLLSPCIPSPMPQIPASCTDGCPPPTRPSSD
jgi:hypothetical protein